LRLVHIDGDFSKAIVELAEDKNDGYCDEEYKGKEGQKRQKRGYKTGVLFITLHFFPNLPISQISKIIYIWQAFQM
jgi:hypothetical protein